MLQISQVKFHVNDDFNIENAKKKVAALIGITTNDFTSFKIIKKSIDARKKPDIFYVYSFAFALKNIDENKLISRNKRVSLAIYNEVKYEFEKCTSNIVNRPVIIGMGPAGLMCGYILAINGYKPIIIERGLDIDSRTSIVNEFWQNGKLNLKCNVQYGEGGAGAFSDGKLNTGVKDKSGRIAKVLDIFCENGACEEIKYYNKPHIGTDILAKVVKNMREKMVSMGAEIHFNTCMTDLIIENGSIAGIKVQKDDTEYLMKSDAVVLAIGHSARDTFYKLKEQSIPMENKAFAVGYRIQHNQSVINKSQYGIDDSKLPAADYKLTYTAKDGRGVYSFCMCPGGYVVNASSEEGMTAINGMSYSKRDSSNANSALVVTITPDDYGHNLLDGVEFQRDIEKKAFANGNGKLVFQRLRDFIDNVPTTNIGRVIPVCKGEYEYGNVRNILPEFIDNDLIEGMDHFGKIIDGYKDDDALLACVESRTSSPVRILRDDNLQSSIKGLYPCGEGAGYAGGITSAAVDGLKVAEKIAMRYNFKR